MQNAHTQGVEMRAQVETLLYGVKNENEDWQEEILCSFPEAFERVKVLAAKDGFGRFRVASINLSAPPDFTKVLNTNLRR